MATIGPNGSWRKPASPIRPSTTASAVAAIPALCSGSAIALVPATCKGSSGDGGGVCPRRLARPMSAPDTGIKWRFGNSKLPTPTCSTGRRQAGCGLKVIRDHLDVGRPDQIALIFRRRVSSRTPGTFRTRVITRGVDPTLCCYYKSSRIKQYFKEGRALRTETVICNTYDFGIGRRVCVENWSALRAVGESANRCLCDAETADAQPAPDVATFCQVTRPSTTDDGLYAPGLRFGDQRVMAVLTALVGFSFLIRGFTNH